MSDSLHRPSDCSESEPGASRFTIVSCQSLLAHFNQDFLNGALLLPNPMHDDPFRWPLFSVLQGLLTPKIQPGRVVSTKQQLRHCWSKNRVPHKLDNQRLHNEHLARNPMILRLYSRCGSLSSSLIRRLVMMLLMHSFSRKYFDTLRRASCCFPLMVFLFSPTHSFCKLLRPRQVPIIFFTEVVKLTILETSVLLIDGYNSVNSCLHRSESRKQNSFLTRLGIMFLRLNLPFLRRGGLLAEGFCGNALLRCSVVSGGGYSKSLSLLTSSQSFKKGGGQGLGRALDWWGSCLQQGGSRKTPNGVKYSIGEFNNYTVFMLPTFEK